MVAVQAFSFTLKPSGAGKGDKETASKYQVCLLLAQVQQLNL